MPIDISGLAVEALKDSPLSMKDKLRTKNFFALGFTYWVYGRPLEPTIEYINNKWAKKAPDVADANIRVLKAGYFLGETTETTRNRYMVARAEVEPGTYRKISGNEAIALGLIAGAKKAARSLRHHPFSKRSPDSSTSASKPCRLKMKSPPSAWPSVPALPDTSASPPPAGRACV
jgi:hypothetical protein